MVLNKKWFIGSGAGAVLLAGSIYGGTALVHAQTAASPSSSASASAGARGAAAQQAQQNFIQHLATRLNISPDAATTALKGAAKDSVADQVKAGKLTQAQADKIDANIDSGKFVPGAFGGRFGHGGPHAGIGRGGVLNAAATALNLKPADLMSQLRSGKTLQQIAQAQNVPFANVQTAITNAVKPKLDQAVASGKMTAQQEQNILSRVTSGDFGARGKGVGPHGRGPNPSASPSASAQP